VGEFGDYADLDPLGQIELDVVTVAELTAAVLPGMLRRQRGAVLMCTPGSPPAPGSRRLRPGSRGRPG
jgi:short-subunit dehydrogenase